MTVSAAVFAIVGLVSWASPVTDGVAGQLRLDEQAGRVTAVGIANQKRQSPQQLSGSGLSGAVSSRPAAHKGPEPTGVFMAVGYGMAHMQPVMPRGDSAKRRVGRQIKKSVRFQPEMAPTGKNSPPILRYPSFHTRHWLQKGLVAGIIQSPSSQICLGNPGLVQPDLPFVSNIVELLFFQQKCVISSCAANRSSLSSIALWLNPPSARAGQSHPLGYMPVVNSILKPAKRSVLKKGFRLRKSALCGYDCRHINSDHTYLKISITRIQSAAPQIASRSTELPGFTSKASIEIRLSAAQILLNASIA